MATFTVNVAGAGTHLFDVGVRDSVASLMLQVEAELGLSRGGYDLVADGGEVLREGVLVREIAELEVDVVPSKKAMASAELADRGIAVTDAALEAACRGLDIAVVELLIAAGASPRVEDLIFAAKEGHVDLVRILQKNLPPTPRDADGDTPLIISAENGHLEVVKYLVENTSFNSLNTANDLGTTPLMAAVSNSYSGVVEYLLSRSELQIDAADVDGDTALHLAAMYQESLLASSLLSSGADPVAQNGRAATPKDVAVRVGCPQTIGVFA